MSVKMRITLRRTFKRSKCNLVIFIFSIVFFSLILWGSILEPFEAEAKSSCLYIPNNKSFPVLEKRSNLPARSIFFLSSTCLGDLTSREFCAVESAARTNPDWQINVVFIGPISYEKNLDEIFNNIKFWRLYVKEFLKGTPFDELYEKYTLRNCRWGARLIRDLIKYLIMKSWGGIYLDLDMLVARPLGSLARNWATRENDDTVGEGILTFSRDAAARNISEIAVNEIQSVIRRRHCSRKRLMVMTSVLKRYCSTTDVAFMSSATCNDFEVYGSQFFHPVPETRARDYFIPKELDTNSAYTYHLWDHITKAYKVMRTSPFARLARRYCPATFKLYSDQFGF